jgi:pyruvate formate lyase activating enzyme
MRSLVYGRPVSVHVDPIEKKPFYHFLPGSQAYSIGTTGCPLRCKFCQNWQTSQASPEDYSVRFTSPGEIVETVRSRKVPVIAYTYNEPLVFTEYLLDIASAARLRGIRSTMVTCGFMAQGALAEMCKALDAVKVDLKGYSESFYRDACGAELKPVLRTIKQIAKSRVHLEIVNLVVPTLNDADRMITELCDWVMGELGPDVPLHFTRFRPDYQMPHLPPTPTATLERARSIAVARGIRYAYVGNVPGHPGNNTVCPSCKKEVIRRTLFFVEGSNIKDGKCGFCGRKIAGVFV